MYCFQLNNLPSLLLLALLFLFPATAQAQKGQMQILGENEIQDSNGRQIQIQEPFRRIVSLYGAHTENLFSLGLTQEIVGVGLHESFPPQAKNKPVFSYQEGPEKILSARPDLILIRPMIDHGYTRLIQTLERSGVTVVSLQPRDIPEMFTYWEILGILTGRQEKAQRMQKDFQAAVQYTRELTAGLEQNKTVFFEAIHGQLKTFAPGSMPIFALQSAGGKNAAFDAKPVRGTNIAEFGKERLLSRADKIQFYLAQKGPMNQPSKQKIKQEPGLHLLPAVQNDNIYIIEEELVSRPTLRLIQGISDIGRILYPHLFTAEVRQRLLELSRSTGKCKSDLIPEEKIKTQLQLDDHSNP